MVKPWSPKPMLGVRFFQVAQIDTYISWLDSHPDKVEVLGSSPSVSTNKYIEVMAIHIKKENRGKFTQTMKRTGKTAEQLKHSKNPLTRKRATFAINARSFKHKKK